MNNDKRYKPCSKCGSREGMVLKQAYEYCCMCGFRLIKDESISNLINREIVIALQKQAKQIFEDVADLIWNQEWKKFIEIKKKYSIPNEKEQSNQKENDK